ncbi:uncharacterized protein LOC113233608 [Hyposmocoma kahamanoa]|uniref:uncharacterized protein LOC113233608 n=1 Tax=Hyposmocoma kahamanoa TaxID=1477025 RepID=UPI000E6D86E6|nr:uncharacterized protein LOC113233608 [Hyposmocoma kahamanoa]
MVLVICTNYANPKHNEKAVDLKASNSDKDTSIQVDKGNTDDNVDNEIINGRKAKPVPVTRKSSAQVIHEKQMKEIHDLMVISSKTTDYFYDEAVRIDTYQTIIDGLRKMLIYLDDPKNSAVKKMVFDCFLKIRATIVPKLDPFSTHVVNDLIIADVNNRF